MKKLLPLFLVICSFVCLFMAGCSFNTQYTPPAYDSGYKIDAYNIDIVINEDRILSVTETITADFLEASRGLVRYLPTVSKAQILDENGKVSGKNYRLKYDNVKVINASLGSTIQYFYEEDNFLYLAIGKISPSVRTETFKFSYTLDLGDDRDTAKDWFYFNVMGTETNTDVYNFTYKVTFPKSFTDQSFYIYKGKMGQDQVGVNQIISGNQISGSYDHLEYGEAVTVKTNFDEGYFNLRRNYTYDIMFVIAEILFLAYLIYMLVKHRYKSPIVEVVEFSSPDDLTPTEAGYIIDKAVEDKDVVALIVYWASKGYIKIKEDESKQITLFKLKDLAEKAKSHEKIFFDALFKKEDMVSLEDCANINLSNAATSTKIIVERENNSKYFNSKPAGLILLANLILLVLMILIGVKVSYDSVNIPGLMITIAASVAVFFISIIYANLYYKKYSLSLKHYKLKKWIYFILLILALVVYCLFVEMYCDPFFSLIVTSILAIANFFVISTINFRTKKGNIITGKLRGLRNYIMVAEKDKLEALVNEHPQVFYNILPYAYVLGVSDKWIDKFEDIDLSPPDWYVMPNGSIFNLYISMSLINSSLRHVTSGIVTARKPSGGNFSGGGGFGGGFSGGGGGFSGGGMGGGGTGRF